jgi:hypothetical protein
MRITSIYPLFIFPFWGVKTHVLHDLENLHLYRASGYQIPGTILLYISTVEVVGVVEFS